jgi:hypothetical protein
MREPRAFRPRAPELIAQIRQVTALGVHRGMGQRQINNRAAGVSG